MHWLAATLLTAAATLALVQLGRGRTVAGMVYLVLVVWLATLVGTWISLYVAVLSALGFDYFFLPPVHSFQLNGGRAWISMSCYVASCLVVSRVAERARRQTRAAEQRREDVERLYELSQEMMLHEDAAGLIRDLPRLIQRIFALDHVIVYVADADRMHASSIGVSPAEQEALRSLARGQNLIAAVEAEPEADFHTMPLTLGMRTLGALGWRPDQLSREVASAMSAQVAIALARSMAIEQTARIEAAREGERLRTALIDSLTHELRTPLTSIRAAATTLLETPGLDDAARQDLTALVDEEARRLDLLIGEAVEMAQIDAHTVEMHASTQHALDLFEQAVEESRKALVGHRVTMTVQGDEEPAWFDPHLLGRVLRHLLENAAHHTPPGSRIALKSWRTAERLEFSVEDSGPGIDPTDLPLIFEKFYRGKQNPQPGGRKSKGSGMGLAIARAILLVHGGGIEAGNLQPHGASFRFWVPLEDKERRGDARMPGGA